MINSGQKGKRYERAIAKKINKFLGTNLRRTPNSGGLSLKGDILEINPASPVFEFHFELKNQKSLHLPKWWKQTLDDCPVSKTPMLVFRMSGEDLVALGLNDWLGLVYDAHGDGE